MSQVVWITGGSRGIGAAAVRLFAAEGQRIAFTYLRSEAAARALEEETGAHAFRMDVSDSAQVRQTHQNIQQQLGEVDILVNNAGVASPPFQLLTDLSDGDWRRLMAVNLDGVFYCCREASASMVRRKSGCIINLSSIWGISGASCEVAYSASKAGVIGLTKALAKELAPSGIRVNCVAPGVIDTDMNASLDAAALEALKEETPLGAIGTPEDAARSILFLASDAARFITGQVLSPNGGLVI